MTNSSAVVFFAFALCIFACVSASAVGKSVKGEAPAHIVEVARQTVEAAIKATNKVIAKGQEELNKANSLLGKVKSFGTEAQNTQSKAERAAEGYETAKEIDQSIKDIYTAVNNLQISATDELQKTISSLGKLLEEAETLKGECDTEISRFHSAAEDYKDTSNKVPDLKRRAGVLEHTIADIFSKINGVQSTTDTMEEKLKEAQLKSFHISTIVAVAQIDTMISNAESIVEYTQNKKNEVDKILQEMQTLKTRATTEAIGDVNNLWKTAEGELAKAAGAVQKANTGKEAMKQQREIADTALTNVQTVKKVDKAQEEVTKAEACVASVGNINPQLQSAQKTAENSLITVKASKQEMETALQLTTNSEPGTEQSLTTAQVKTLQSSVSAAVTQITTMMEEAERTLKEAKKHKQEVHDIVEEMQTLKTTAKVESNDINELCRTSEGELTRATNAVAKVTIEKEAMSQQKQLAEVALTEVNKATEIDKAQPHVATATSCLGKAKGNLAHLRIALQTAKSSVAKTNDLMQKFKTALLTTTTALTSEEVEETKKSDIPVQGTTEANQKDTTIQPTSKDSLHQTDNSADKLKDTLIKDAQNVPITALTGGKAPAPGANNDSAMTVSVPLLVALIASAVLQ